ncbi:CPBP family intramembrane glutamic endopeptidase [Halalkalicoccus subterraneus]|uniref:CPBP family intramembrane glutamic endopeptidase n=1 Tax=Halalkalicoccus subterraneus TaxID=2675002 RepID=UPI000EFB77E0|nr:CPBP family intramembrane glutamic endopeptidase [Halalkalicoccus subterraneus]
MANWATFVGLTGVVTLLLLALSHASQTAISEPDSDIDVEPTSGLLLVNVALSQGVFLSLLLAAAWYTQIPRSALGVSGGSTGTAALGAGLAVGTALYVASELGGAVADRLDVEYDEGLRELLAPDSPGGWAVLLGLVLPVIAVFEEVLFRAALIGAVAAGYGVSPWLLAVLSSILFALGHGAQGTSGIVVTGLLGFALAAAFIVTESLLVVVLAHYLVNALEFLIHEGIGIEWL